MNARRLLPRLTRAMLGDTGFRDISVLRGGMEQWNRDGRPVENGSGTTGPAAQRDAIPLDTIPEGARK